MVTKRNRTRRTYSFESKAGKGLAATGVLICGALLFSFFFDEMGFSKYMAMWKRAEVLKRDIDMLEHANAGLRKEIFRLKHDSARVEELAREQLGLVRQGETVYQLIQPEKHSPARK